LSEVPYYFEGSRERGAGKGDKEDKGDTEDKEDTGDTGDKK
jgi:hypothetical protein